MLREARMKREPEIVRGFRMRGREVTRLESFSDAVFGFALTLLVVSLEVPKSFDQLIETMRGFLAFAVCFAILASIWNQHYLFCRRFGLQDGFVRFLTCGLLFIVLLYVYPLKFLFNLFINGMILRGARGATHRRPGGRALCHLRIRVLRHLSRAYGALFACFSTAARARIDATGSIRHALGNLWNALYDISRGRFRNYGINSEIWRSAGLSVSLAFCHYVDPRPDA